IDFVSAVSTSLALMDRRQTGKEPAVPKIKLVIDEFSDLNPANRYYIVSGDDSSMSLVSSRITFSAEYSMRMRYGFDSSRPTGSWVEAQRYFSPDLDWTGVQSVKIWVKGDTSNNIFRFTLTDGEGNNWVCDNQKVLASSDWYLVNMPVENFVMYKELYQGKKSKRDIKENLHAIRRIGIGIISQPNRSSSSQGEILVEKLYITGRNIDPDRAVPLSERSPIGIYLPLKNWNIGGTSETLLEEYPTIGSDLTQEIKFKLNGNFKKFSILGEICMKSTFGNDDDGFRAKAADVSGTNTSVTILDPVDGISNIIVGNLWFDSSQHIFANNNLYGEWGFTGAMVEGWIDRLHHRTYFLKHAPDSYTLAGHYAMTIHDLNINLMGTYYKQEPFIQSATKLEDDDKALFLDLSQKIIIPNVFNAVVRLQAGYDWYQKYWDVSTQTEIDERSGGSYLEGELNFSELSNLFWPGVSLTGKYRYVEPGYKPALRRDPGYWDIEYGDQKGYNARFYQKFGGAFISAEYDKIDRISNFAQHRERTLLSIGYNDWSALDITLTQEFATKIYHYIDTRYMYNGQPANLNEDKRENTTTLYLSYHLGSAFTISEWLQFKDILQFENNEEYTEMIAVTRVSYSPAPNISFSLENKFSRYGREEDIPTIDPNDPYSIYEYTRVRIDLTF
ncbi:CIA30 family protein, partial [bacterium]|nr:CIA30 family protein [bacterium]